MAGLKREVTSIRFGGNKISPDEIDQYYRYTVFHPTTSATWVGTTAVGGTASANALVLINKFLDYPRNLLVTCSGSNDLGGTFTINGKDQFNNTISETIGFGTVVSPGTTAAGTKIFSQVTSGTWQFASGSVGNGTPKLGVTIGGTVGSTAIFGLTTKIAAITDVKSITHSKAFVVTTLDGGTISSSIVNATRHSFNGTAALGTADIFVVTIRPTYNNENGADMAR